MTDLPIYRATLLAQCTCRDDDAASVAALMLRGFTQREASLLVYANDPGPDASAAVWSEWVRRQVAEMTAGLRAKWGLA